MRIKLSSIKKKLSKREIVQYKKTYYSTLAFNNFIKKKISKSNSIVDIGSGQGGTISFYCKKYRDIDFVGLDYRDYNVKISKYFSELNKINNIKFYKIDLIKHNLKKKFKKYKLNFPDGIISEKTFCTFKNLDKVIKNLISLKPNFIAINSLFYKGEIDVYIHIASNRKITYNKKNVDGDFNIHSIQKLKTLLKNYNYKITSVKDFFPKKKIVSDKLKRGTYTMNTEINKNTMFSGPVYLPWKFIMIEKIGK